MRVPPPKLQKQIFEARYERGYRYLDRCGEAMLILEELLAAQTGKIWLPGEMQPQGAHLKCPELDMTVVFDTAKLGVEQTSPDAEAGSAYGAIVTSVVSTITTRFELRNFTRFGLRSFVLFPTDSIEEAERLSIKYGPLDGWVTPPQELSLVNSSATATFETSDRKFGAHVKVESFHVPAAPIELDKRLTIPPRLLHENQRKALIDQLKRNKERAANPLAGMMMDVDVYRLSPDNADEFLAEAAQLCTQVVTQILEGKK